MSTHDAQLDHLSLIDYISRANEKIDAAKYGHLHTYHIGDRVASFGKCATVLFVGLESIGILDDSGHAHLRFPSEVQGPFYSHLPKVYVQGAARRVTGRSNK